MAEIAYQDFDLSLDRTPGGLRASVRASPAGSASTDFVLPFSRDKLENYVLRLGHVRRIVRRLETAEMQGAREFGGGLFQAIFTGEVGACFRSSLAETRRRGQGLRLRLRVNDAELWGLPWEYLYDPARHLFLALSVHTPLVRYLEIAEPVPVLAVDPPLRVLVMIASPADHAPLDVEREWRLLNEAVGTLHPARRVVIERLNEPTLQALQRRLRRDSYHVFHFIGHGGYDQEQDEGVLLLEDDDRKGDVVSSRHLGMLLHDHRPLRIAVLNACEGARSSLVDPFAGSAQTLVQLGLPAVVAMQFEIGDEVAVIFAQEFYGALADGYPIDAAVTESRKAIYASGHEAAWGTPVLYMRTPDGRIFDVKGTGHPVSGLEAPKLARAAGAATPVAAFVPPAPNLGAEWGLASIEAIAAPMPLVDAGAADGEPVAAPPVVVEPVVAADDDAREIREAERKRLSEADTLDKASPDRATADTVAALLERARMRAAHGRQAEALHLVGQALAREPASIEARVLKRHLLHAMSAGATEPPWKARAATLAQSLVRPAAGLLALAVLALLAVALAKWRAVQPEPPSAALQSKPPDAVTARHEPGATGAESPATTPTATPSAIVPADPPAPVAGAVATGAKGRLVLYVPAETEVAVDGKAAGRAPVHPIELTTGFHEVALRHPLHGALRRRVSVGDAGPTRLVVDEEMLRTSQAGLDERRARRALADGQQEQALAIAAAALPRAPGHEGLRRFLADFAKRAMTEAIAARQAAERAGRAARRSRAFAQGDDAFERAERAHDGGQLTDAIPLYWTARTQFEQAAREK